MWNQYLTPNSLAEALQFTQQYQERARLLAGGTDLIPDFSGERLASVEAVVDISRLPELKKIDLQSGIITIGSAVALSEIINSELLNHSVPILVAAARQIAGPQIRNVATIGGNVVNASPAADMVPGLLVLDCLVSIAKFSGRDRKIPLQAFLLGNRKVDLSAGEIVTGFSFSMPDPTTRHYFRKVQPRRAMAIAMLNLAILLKVEHQIITDVRVAMGAVASTAVRVRSVEHELRNLPIHMAADLERYDGISQDILPISDFRASRDYRLKVARNLLREAIIELVESTPSS
jgi:CO/xanthine dehydrogenase FAD-binding subunit